MRRIPRKFYLSSAAGERFGLNGERSVWLTEPGGLGLELSPGFSNGRNGFFAAVLTDDVPQGAAYGTLVFTGASPYASYQDFLSWALAAGDGLLLVYEPMPGKEFYRRVMLTSLTKGEIEAPGWLRCEATFQTLTPWYSLTQLRFDLTPDGGDGADMTYQWFYTEELIYPVDTAGAMRAELTAGGHMNSAMALEYVGPATNPSIRLVGVSSGRSYGQLSLEVTLSESDRLEYSSRYLDSYVRLIGADGTETDLMPSVDLAYEPWLRIPLSEPVTFVMTASSALPGDATVKVYDYYRSV